MLLLAFPELKGHPGPVSNILEASSATPGVKEYWQGLVAEDIRRPTDDDDI